MTAWSGREKRVNADLARLFVIQKPNSLTDQFVNSFFKKACYRAHCRRCFFAAAVLSLANCSTSDTAYNHHAPARDQFYGDRQESGENGPPQSRRPTWTKATTKDPAPTNPTLTLLHLQRTHILKAAVSRADDIPTAKPGQNGLVGSPFVPGKKVDIQGYPPGATVINPYTNKMFIVPMPTSTPINRIRKPTRREYRRMSQAGFRGPIQLDPPMPLCQGQVETPDHERKRLAGQISIRFVAS